NSTDIFKSSAGGSGTSGNFNTNPLQYFGFVALTSDPYAGNHIGGVTDLVVNASNNTWVTSATIPFVVTGTTPSNSSFTANDIGLKIMIYGGTGWTPGIYTVVGFDAGTSSAILNFSPAATSATGGKMRIADFRPNAVAGGGAALRGACIGAIGQVDAIDIGAVQHAASGGGGGGGSILQSSIVQGGGLI